MKQKFDIKFKDDIESKKIKVETKLGSPVTIYSWDGGTIDYPIIASVAGVARNYSVTGEVDGTNRNMDLYVYSLPDLTNFERGVMDAIGRSMEGDYTYPKGDEKYTEHYYEDIRKVASELYEKAIDGIIIITTAYSNVPELKHDTQGGTVYVHYMNFCFYPTELQKLDWVKRKYFPELLEENNKDE